MVSIRLPRLFEKKRGSRRTGSQAWGRAGEACFYAALLAAGMVFTAMLGRRIVEAPGGLASIGLWMWLLTLLLPGALLSIGGSGLARLIHGWGRSEEGMAALRRFPEMFQPSGRASEVEPFPSVPPWENLNNSPSTILRYRLPLESPESWSVFGFGLFAVLWNAVVVLLAVTAGVDFVGGQTDWLLLSILVPFVAIGVAGVVIFVRALVLQTAVGPTQIEIADHPLRPGDRCDVYLGQGGRGMFRRIALSLELEELATFRQGTDTRTERRVVHEIPFAEWRAISIAPGRRFEERASFEVPAEAMHSFASLHNAVTWRIAVHVEPAKWPRFTRHFPIIVLPQRTGPALLNVPPSRLAVVGSGR